MITVIYIIYRFSAEFVSSCQVIQDHVSGSQRENNSAVVSTILYYSASILLTLYIYMGVLPPKFVLTILKVEILDPHTQSTKSSIIALRTVLNVVTL